MGAGMAGRRVLVVDDDPALRQILHAALIDDGYETRTATSGAEALTLLQAWRPDLIMLDLMMADGDGWSFRRVQLTNPTLAGIPVVLVSAALALEREGEKLGVAAVVAKPYDLDTVLTLVADLLEPTS